MSTFEDKYKMKVRGTRNRYGIEFKLSLDEYIQMAMDANITAEQIGRSVGEYVLGRHNDTGDYEVGNCSFIPSSENNSQAHKGKVVSDDTKKLQSIAAMGRVIHDNTKQALLASITGRVMSEETKNKIRLANAGKSHNKGTPKPKVKCPHCGKIGGAGTMGRWHFDNCKTIKETV